MHLNHLYIHYCLYAFSYLTSLWPPQRQVERLRQLCIGSDGAELLAYLFAAWALEETRRDVHTDRSGTSDEI